MDVKNFELLADRFLNGLITEDEKKDLFLLINSDEKLKNKYLLLAKRWVNKYKESVNEKVLRERAYKKVLNEIEGKSRKKLIFKTLKVSAVAASIVLALTIGYIAENRPEIDYHSELNVKDSVVKYQPQDSTFKDLKTEVVVPRGSRVKIVLADGSKAWINADSKLSYNNNFSTNNRDLYLNGEAYFEVAKGQSVPFKVFTKNICITAIGTAFNVESYTNHVKTTLANGSVIISSKSGETKTLQPNQSIEYISDSIGFSSVKNVQTELYTSWKDTRWIIRSMSMEEFASKLEKKFDVIIMFEDPLIKEKRITGTLSNETIEQIMQALKSSICVDYSFNKNQITLKNYKTNILPK
ncbi:MAG: FecR family protein [Rikenellaceae bacterium]